MPGLTGIISCFLLFINALFEHSMSSQLFMNPVIPVDYPDCEVTKIENEYYATGSSFNAIPVIYYSTDSVSREAIAQPISTSWPKYGYR
jgi:beta-xylosidase